MCGIAGIINWTNDRDMRSEYIETCMLDTMKQRGPDERASYHHEFVSLLHARLCIVDLDNGKQPMCKQAHGIHYAMVYNGELYNTLELRKELLVKGYTFQGYGDSEVLLTAYMEWGASCVEKLNGIFAFAIWEEETRRLFVARDRMGVKPFFYTWRKGAFLFASELKTLLAHPMMEARIDATGISEVMLLGPGRSSGCGVFMGIEELKPAMMGYVDKGKMQVQPYWLLQDRIHTDDFETSKQTVRKLVIEAVDRQLVSDVGLGCFLSGGLDSSILCALANRSFQKQGKKLQTFSVNYEENNKYFVANKFQPNEDKQYIDLMVNYLGSEHHDIIIKTPQLVNALFEAVDARDLPGMADVDSSLLLFCKEVKKHVQVALSGECADEIFGGYPWYRDKEIRDAYGFPWAQNTDYRHNFIKAEIKEHIATSYVDERYLKTLMESDACSSISKEEKRMREMVNLNMKWFMQTLLDRKDRMTMHNSLEVRVPFCDMNIVDYLYSVPWKYKDHNGYEKALLREAVSDLLPEEIVWRKKSPYPKTFHPEYRKAVSSLLLEIMHNPNEPLLQIVEKKQLEALLQENRAIPWYGQLMTTPQTIAYFVQMNYWLKKYQIKLSL